ncbi:Protein of unknown function [Propionibacterium freudenreichii]|uniref:hypothetical protein n=1 Tax=Propionibacterium freudenreichii TaxID=1744 RepID=UPI0005434BEA|nr:hypothetical protein [Propionibacterium freudenreichii]CEG89005.1 Protein of unknown function [Propionibacterium freudenreichii]
MSGDKQAAAWRQTVAEFRVRHPGVSDEKLLTKLVEARRRVSQVTLITAAAAVVAGILAIWSPWHWQCAATAFVLAGVSTASTLVAVQAGDAILGGAQAIKDAHREDGAA